MACMCGDPYCGSCGPAQGFHKCEHKAIQGDCEIMDCPNGPDDHYISCSYCKKLHLPSFECKEQKEHYRKLAEKEAAEYYQFELDEKAWKESL